MRAFSVTALLLIVGIASAQDRPARWEYAELSYRTTPGRAAGKTRDGAEVPATPAVTTLRWSAGDAEVEAKGWDELAEKVNAPGKKATANPRLRVLNALGGEGWELVSQQNGTGINPFPSPDGGPRGFSPGTATTMLFKRRAR